MREIVVWCERCGQSARSYPHQTITHAACPERERGKVLPRFRTAEVAHA